MEDQEGELPLLDRVEKADVAQRPQRRRQQAGTHVDDSDVRVAARERVEDPHLVGDRSDVYDLADIGMNRFKVPFGDSVSNARIGTCWADK
jgi:hypothetical protein